MTIKILNDIELNYYIMLDEIRNNSPCSKRKVGAILFKDSTYVTGYNYPAFRTDNITVDSNGETLSDIVHAEMDILAKLTKLNTMSTLNAVLFTTLSPCFQCAKNLVRTGVKAIYFRELHKVPPLILLIDSGIEVYQEIFFNPDSSNISTLSATNIPSSINYPPAAIFKKLNDAPEYKELLRLSKEIPSVFYHKPY